jgi:CheY-like chemotaxis protein
MTERLNGPVSVLIVEDNSSDAELAVDGLADASASTVVHVVGDGIAALDYLRDGHRRDGVRRPDLVVLDLNLPRMGGLETLGELKGDEELRDVPVIVLTTSKSQREINGCYHSGAAAVLNKPMRLSDYRQMLNALQQFWLEHVLLPRDAS